MPRCVHLRSLLASQHHKQRGSRRRSPLCQRPVASKKNSAADARGWTQMMRWGVTDRVNAPPKAECLYPSLQPATNAPAHGLEVRRKAQDFDLPGPSRNPSWQPAVPHYSRFYLFCSRSLRSRLLCNPRLRNPRRSRGQADQPQDRLPPSSQASGRNRADPTVTPGAYAMVPVPRAPSAPAQEGAASKRHTRIMSR